MAVTLGGYTQTVTAGGSGAYTTTFVAANIPTDTTSTNVTVIATDVAGNISSTTTHPIAIDTVSTTPTITTVATDDKINASEKTAGVGISGVAEAGASVAVTLGGYTQTVTADGSGAYTTTFVTANIPADTTSTNVTVIATDVNGNVSATTTHAIAIDTTNPTVTITTNDSILGIGETATITITFSEMPISLPAITPSVEGSLSTLIQDTNNPLAYTAILTPPVDTPSAMISFSVGEWSASGRSGIIGIAATVAVDTIAPDAPIITPIGNIYNPSYDVGFSVEAGASVTVTGTTIDKFTKTTADNVDTYTAKPNDFVGSETITINAIMVDSAGNSSSAIPATLQPIDTSATLPVVALAIDSGTASDKTTNNANELSITNTSDGDVISYQIGVNATLAASAAPSDTYASPLTDGSYTVIVTDTDLAGNTGSTSLVFTLDTTVHTPIVTLTTDAGISSDFITNNANLNIVRDTDIKTTRYTIDGIEKTAYNPLTITDGAHSVEIVDIDNAGNESGIAYISFTLDKTLPVKPTVALGIDSGSSASDRVTNDASYLALSDLLEGDITRTYKIGNDAPTYSYTAPTVDGIYTLVVTDTDLAGNANYASLVFTLDTTVVQPIITLTTDSGTMNNDFLTKNAALTFSIKPIDVTRTYSINDATATSIYTAPTGDGDYTVVVTDTDTAGNSVTSSISFSLDRTAPDTPPTIDEYITGDNVISESEASVGVTIGGTVEAGSTVSIVDPKLTVTALTDASGAWSYTLSSSEITTLGTGLHNVTLSATDAAGNTSNTTPKSFEIGYSIANGATLQPDSGTNGFIANIYSIIGNTTLDGSSMLGTGDSIKILNGSLDLGESITINNAMSAVSSGGTIDIADSSGSVTINIDNNVTGSSFTNTAANPNVSVNILGDFAISNLSIAGAMGITFGLSAQQQDVNLLSNGVQTFIYAGYGDTNNNLNISGFAVGTDKIDLSSLLITGTNKVLNAESFVSGAGAVALDANDFIINDTTNGRVYYDADGSGSGSAVLLFTLADHAALSNTDFKVL